MKETKISECFQKIEKYCKEHKGLDKVHCHDNGCVFCQEETTPFYNYYSCKLKELTW